MPPQSQNPWQFLLPQQQQNFLPAGQPLPQPQAAAQPQAQPQQNLFTPQMVQQLLQPQQHQGLDFGALIQALHQPSRHLGMGGEDITNQKGPYDSGGIDWLHGHNDGTNGRVTTDPMAQAQTQSDMMAAFAPKAALPFTQTMMSQLVQPRPQVTTQNPNAMVPFARDQFAKLMQSRG